MASPRTRSAWAAVAAFAGAEPPDTLAAHTKSSDAGTAAGGAAAAAIQYPGDGTPQTGLDGDMLHRKQTSAVLRSHVHIPHTQVPHTARVLRVPNGILQRWLDRHMKWHALERFAAWRHIFLAPAEDPARHTRLLCDVLRHVTSHIEDRRIHAWRVLVLGSATLRPLSLATTAVEMLLASGIIRDTATDVNGDSDHETPQQSKQGYWTPPCRATQDAALGVSRRRRIPRRRTCKREHTLLREVTSGAGDEEEDGTEPLHAPELVRHASRVPQPGTDVTVVRHLLGAILAGDAVHEAAAAWENILASSFEDEEVMTAIAAEGSIVHAWMRVWAEADAGNAVEAAVRLGVILQDAPTQLHGLQHMDPGILEMMQTLRTVRDAWPLSGSIAIPARDMGSIVHVPPLTCMQHWRETGDAGRLWAVAVWYATWSASLIPYNVLLLQLLRISRSPAGSIQRVPPVLLRMSAPRLPPQSEETMEEAHTLRKEDDASAVFFIDAPSSSSSSNSPLAAPDLEHRIHAMMDTVLYADADEVRCPAWWWDTAVVPAAVSAMVQRSAWAHARALYNASPATSAGSEEGGTAGTPVAPTMTLFSLYQTRAFIFSGAADLLWLMTAWHDALDALGSDAYYVHSHCEGGAAVAAAHSGSSRGSTTALGIAALLSTRGHGQWSAFVAAAVPEMQQQQQRRAQYTTVHTGLFASGRTHLTSMSLPDMNPVLLAIGDAMRRIEYATALPVASALPLCRPRATRLQMITHTPWATDATHVLRFMHSQKECRMNPDTALFRAGRSGIRRHTVQWFSEARMTEMARWIREWDVFSRQLGRCRPVVHIHILPLILAWPLTQPSTVLPAFETQRLAADESAIVTEAQGETLPRQCAAELRESLVGVGGLSDRLQARATLLIDTFVRHDIRQVPLATSTQTCIWILEADVRGNFIISVPDHCRGNALRQWKAHQRAVARGEVQNTATAAAAGSSSAGRSTGKGRGKHGDASTRWCLDPPSSYVLGPISDSGLRLEAAARGVLAIAGLLGRSPSWNDIGVLVSSTGIYLTTARGYGFSAADEWFASYRRRSSHISTRRAAVATAALRSALGNAVAQLLEPRMLQTTHTDDSMTRTAVVELFTTAKRLGQTHWSAFRGLRSPQNERERRWVWGTPAAFPHLIASPHPDLFDVALPRPPGLNKLSVPSGIWQRRERSMRTWLRQFGWEAATESILGELDLVCKGRET